MEKSFKLDETKIFRNEKITNRCFNYCVRELVQKNLFDYEEACIMTCTKRLNDHFDHFLNKSLSVFKSAESSDRN